MSLIAISGDDSSLVTVPSCYAFQGMVEACKLDRMALFHSSTETERVRGEEVIFENTYAMLFGFKDDKAYVVTQEGRSLQVAPQELKKKEV